MSMKVEYDILYKLDDLQLEIALDCLYYQAMLLLKKIVELVINTTDIDKALSIRNILRKYCGACHPRDVDREYRSVYQKIVKLAECVEHNSNLLKDIAKAVGVEMKISVDPGICIEEAIDWTLKSQ